MLPGKFSCGIYELLYSGGLRCYLEYLESPQRYYLHLIENCFDKNDYKAAIDICNKALQINPDCVDFYIFRSQSYLNLKNYDKSLEDCNEALKINPSSDHLSYLSHVIRTCKIVEGAMRFC
ncbi:tetratricopeptide repeat protein [Nostoc commune]|uniref:tetratricopeptide repeat protein n=1 Tax=Nostoc commune TaxID=1178 RepID=UPI0039BF17FC|nr:tetratricopeptide repeat protein [Nostoc commune BAE]